MQRPVFVSVFAILNFVFAALGVIGLIASFGLLSLPAGSDNPVIQFIHASPGYATWLKVCIALEIVCCVALLVTGVGFLGLKPWARNLALGYSIYAIVFCLVGMLVNLTYMVQPMLGQIEQQRAFETVCAIGGPIGGTIGGFFWLIYPLLLLGFMLRPKVSAVFQSPVPAS